MKGRKSVEKTICPKTSTVFMKRDDQSSYNLTLKIALFGCCLLQVAGMGISHLEKSFWSLEKNTEESKNVVMTEGDSREIVRKAVSKLLTAESFRAQSVVTSSKGVEAKLEAEYVAPNRFRVVGIVPGKEKTKLEVIEIGGVTYTRGFEANWVISQLEKKSYVEELKSTSIWVMTQLVNK